MRKEEINLFNKYVDTLITYGHRDLDDVYDKYSDTKKEIFNDIRKDKVELNGSCLTITSANPKVFCAGFLYRKDDDVVLRYYKPSKTLDIVLDEVARQRLTEEGIG